MFNDIVYFHVSDMFLLYSNNTLYKGSCSHYDMLSVYVFVPYIAATKHSRLYHCEVDLPTKKQLTLFKLKNHIEPPGEQFPYPLSTLIVDLSMANEYTKMHLLTHIDPDVIIIE